MYERCDTTKHSEQTAVEFLARRKSRWKLGAGEKLPVLEVLGRGVILGKATRNALEPFTLERADGPPERRRENDGREPPMVAGNVLANDLQLRGLRRPQAPANPHAVGRGVKVHPGAFVFGRPRHGKTAATCVLYGVLFSENRVSR
jgi:hypothetical protein